MGRFHVYLTPFDADGNYGTEVEITSDVVKIGRLRRQLDLTEYDIGIFRTSNVRLALRNDHGKYGEANTPLSVFRTQRTDSKVRITWEPADETAYFGFCEASFPYPIASEEIELFRGLLSDIPSKESLGQQDIDFEVLGLDSVFERVETPYASITNGDDFSDIFLALLNQTEITDRMTVSAGNLTPGTDIAIDDKSDLENTTVLEALKKLLLPANSVLFLDGTTVYVDGRDAEATSQFTFYGPGASDGIENILDVKDFRLGQNRIFNYLTWKDTNILREDATSVLAYGTRKKEIGLELVTNNTNRGTILENIRDEFKNPKREIKLTVALTPETAALKLKDRVLIDYPSVPIPATDELARYDVGHTYDTTYRYPYELSNATISTNDPFKILGISLDFGKQTLEIEVREI